MSIYLERCDICREYRPVILRKEGRSVINICIRCAYLLGKIRLETRDKTSETSEKESPISKVMKEISAERKPFSP